jgi:hypothetical protein
MTDQNLFGDGEVVGNGETKKRRGRPPKPKTPEAEEAAKKTSGAVKAVLDAYIEGFRVRWNSPEDVTRWRADKTAPLLHPEMAWGRDGALAKRMIATWGEKDVLALVKQFFTTTDPRITRTSYKFIDFYNTAQHLMLRGRRISDRRTADNVDAAMRAMGKG